MKYLVALILLLFPSRVSCFILRIIGGDNIKIGKNVKIGFSLILTPKIFIGDDVRIGHLNLILNNELELKNSSIIGYLNILKGPFKLLLKSKAAIGNKNYITRGPIGVSYGESVLELGELTKITVNHHLDLTQSVKFGDYSILAGIKSQMWTHGYVHAPKGPERFRVDGSIEVGNNVYIGSGCIFNPGVKVCNSAHIGAGSVISKNLTEQGMYVNQSLRKLEYSAIEIKNKLEKLENEILIENVYLKK